MEDEKDNVNPNENENINYKEEFKKKMDLLDKMMDEITFSDDEEEQNNKQPFTLDQNTYNNEMTKIKKLYEQNQEEGVDEGTMNSYTGTRHEIINEMERKDLPAPYEISNDNKFEECGYIKDIVENKILMVASNNNISQILNLDNIIFLSDRQYIGFIDDVIGQIDNPTYVIKLYPKLLEQNIFEKIHINDKLYYCSDKVNVVNAIELKNKNKGCDASNAFDEEVSEGEKDYSDDEEEVNAKTRRKNKRKNKKIKTEENATNDKDKVITHNNDANSNPNSGLNIINAPYSVNNINKSKEELNKQMDMFVNNAMNLNINPFNNPFSLNNDNIHNNNNQNNINQ